MSDTVTAIKTWQKGRVIASIAVVAHLSVSDAEPGDINEVVNSTDVFVIVVVFTGHPYPFGRTDVAGPYSKSARSL